jgi:hypothetical protein
VRLTVKLRGRTEAPDLEPRAHNVFRAHGDTTEHHGPLQRLLGPLVVVCNFSGGDSHSQGCRRR